MIPEINRVLGLRELVFQWERKIITKAMDTCIYN